MRRPSEFHFRWKRKVPVPKTSMVSWYLQSQYHSYNAAISRKVWVYVSKLLALSVESAIRIPFSLNVVIPNATDVFFGDIMTNQKAFQSFISVWTVKVRVFICDRNDAGNMTRHAKIAVIAYANSTRAISAEHMLFVHVSDMPRGYFSQTIRRVASLWGRACEMKDWKSE